MEKKLYTIEEVASLLGVTTHCVYQYVSHGRLKCCRLQYIDEQGYVRYRSGISEDHIDEFIANDRAYQKILEKRMLRAEIEERLNRLALLEEQERWDDRFICDFTRRLGL